MRKGFSSLTIAIAVGVIMLVFGVAFVVKGVSATKVESTPEPASTTCPNDCINNIAGTRCMSIFEEGNYEKSFCGCITSEDCITGGCDNDNRCK